jgi:dihydrofolate reductase
MKRLILQMQISVDGFGATNDPAVDWMLWDWGPSCPWDAALKKRFNETIEGIDTVLLSGPMAEGYIDHWTSMAQQKAGDPDYAFTDRIVAARKRVISRSLATLHRPRTSIGRDPLLDEVAALKQGEGSDIICFGGTTFAAALLDGGAVDELQLYVNPFAISGGQSVFKRPRALRCLEATAYDCGIVVQRYQP